MYIEIKVGSGPGLVFIVFAEIIAGFSPPQFWSILFYFMLLTLGVDSIFGSIETIIAVLSDSSYFKNTRKEFLSGNTCIIMNKYWINLN